MIDHTPVGCADLRDPQACEARAAGAEPPDRMTTKADSGSSRQTPLAGSVDPKRQRRFSAGAFAFLGRPITIRELEEMG
jgi:hypothetical protein